ncbi:Pentapeptide repeat-containing protein [Lentzea waywayandensis]|uniref:Pentapeptide repeat-containing protein n=1 Tax=Lentzea waywayandensis TaxID=84724 RepID=A0A1I6ELC5_9PSEU|nr:pentapeptide repeat-containing protein [Lentzea waywayandensis]SFR18447.1 Pentapeptide repeat-containing protein [Lentzea waywayandensis]
MRVAWLVAVLAALLTTAATGVALWLVKAPPVEIVKTAGVAGGAVVALYALWLNDRKHNLESEKVADERFARSVEMLGNEADQVRVGAMHSLVWLANSTPRYKQTVIDVLCAYLRRPFSHSSWDLNAADPDTTFPDDLTREEQQEQQVRRTAQRLIRDLLSWGNKKKDFYDLDLTGAALEYFQLDGRRVNRFTARRAQFYGITTLPRMHIRKPTLFSGATFHGRLNLTETKFDGGVAFTEATFKGEVDFRATTVDTFLALTDPPPRKQTGELTVLPDTAMRTEYKGWKLSGSPKPATPRLEDHVQQHPGGSTDGVSGDDDRFREGDGYVAADPAKANLFRLPGEGLGDERDPETEPDEVKK